MSSTPQQAPSPEPADNSESPPAADAQAPDDKIEESGEEYVFKNIVGAESGRKERTNTE
jgi:hypothetical protein